MKGAAFAGGPLRFDAAGRSYGRFMYQALIPWVAAYSRRAPGTIVSPGTSTTGSPSPATDHDVVPFASRRTPKSFET